MKLRGRGRLRSGCLFWGRCWGGLGCFKGSRVDAWHGVVPFKVVNNVQWHYRRVALLVAWKPVSQRELGPGIMAHEVWGVIVGGAGEGGFTL